MVTMGEEFDIYDMLVQDDNKIVIAGQYNSSDFLQIRLLENSNIDTGFGNSGYCVTDIHESEDMVISIGKQSDGNIVLSGSSEKNDNIDMVFSKYYSGVNSNIFEMTDPGFLSQFPQTLLLINL